MKALQNPSGRIVRTSWIDGETRCVVTGPVNANGKSYGTVVETRLNPSGRTVKTNWIAGKTRWGATVSIRFGNHKGIILKSVLKPSGRTVRTNWIAGEAPCDAGSLLLGKTGALERHPGALDSSCFEKMERWKGALARWNVLAWKKWSAGKAPWGAGSVLLGQN